MHRLFICETSRNISCELLGIYLEVYELVIARHVCKCFYDRYCNLLTFVRQTLRTTNICVTNFTHYVCVTNLTHYSYVTSLTHYVCLCDKSYAQCMFV